MMYSNIDRYTIDKSVNISSELRNQLGNAAKNKSHDIDTFSRMQGCMMLIYSIVLLIIDCFIKDSLSVSGCGYFLIFSIMGFLSFLMSRVLLQKWKYVFMISLVVILLPCIAFIPNISTFFSGITIEWLKVGIITFLLLPIIWRVFYNWLYSNVYSRFIHAKIKNEYQTFEKTRQSIKNRTTDNIDERYSLVFKEYFNNSGELDTDNSCAEKYVDIIIKHLNTIPGIFELLRYIRNESKEKEDNNDKDIKEKEVVQRLCDQNKRYEEMSVKYQGLNPKKPSLEVFCKENGVNYVEFKEYWRKYLNKKKHN